MNLKVIFVKLKKYSVKFVEKLSTDLCYLKLIMKYFPS